MPSDRRQTDEELIAELERARAILQDTGSDDVQRAYARGVLNALCWCAGETHDRPTNPFAPGR